MGIDVFLLRYRYSSPQQPSGNTAGDEQSSFVFSGELRGPKFWRSKFRLGGPKLRLDDGRFASADVPSTTAEFAEVGTHPSTIL